MKNQKKIGVSGDIGSFSEEAASHYLQKEKISGTIIYLIDMEGVLAGVEAQTVDLGILPVVNIQGGLVKPAFAAMGKHAFKPIDDIWIDVQHCLIAQGGTHLNEIEKIFSHPQALAQCKHYLEKEFPDTEIVSSLDTAQAARHLSEKKLGTNAAVIASKQAAQQFHLSVLMEKIQDKSPNLTAFVIVENHLKTGEQSW